MKKYYTVKADKDGKRVSLSGYWEDCKAMLEELRKDGFYVLQAYEEGIRDRDHRVFQY